LLPAARPAHLPPYDEGLPESPTAVPHYAKRARVSEISTVDSLDSLEAAEERAEAACEELLARPNDALGEEDALALGGLQELLDDLYSIYAPAPNDDGPSIEESFLRGWEGLEEQPVNSVPAGALPGSFASAAACARGCRVDEEDFTPEEGRLIQMQLDKAEQCAIAGRLDDVLGSGMNQCCTIRSPSAQQIAQCWSCCNAASQATIFHCPNAL